MPPRRALSCRAFTLAELAASLAAISVLTVALGSSIMVATRSLPSKDHSIARLRKTAEVLRQFEMDLRYARTFRQRGIGAIEFIVADRDGDAVVEIIRYEREVTGQARLVRTYNGDATTLLDPCEAFQLSYRTSLRADSSAYLSCVIVKIQHLSDGLSTLDSAIPLMARPEVTP